VTFAVVLVVAYLLGSVPTSYIVVYRLTGQDIRSMGNGNPGTMNVLDSVGWGAAVIVGVGDICKGAAAVMIAYTAGLGDLGAVTAGMIAVIGHDFSIFLRFDGGNGTAALIGGLLAIIPLETLVVASISIAIGVMVRSRRLGGIVGLALLPAAAYASHVSETKLLGTMLLMAFTVLKIIRFEGFSPERPPR
jgi:glycerol-3-phosphate acyltransferase PlsY